LIKIVLQIKIEKNTSLGLFKKEAVLNERLFINNLRVPGYLRIMANKLNYIWFRIFNEYWPPINPFKNFCDIFYIGCTTEIQYIGIIFFINF